MMYLIVPLSVGDVTTLLQFTLATLLVFCCRLKPVEGEGHDTNAVFVVVSVMESNGAPGVCTTESKLQNPPVMEKFPPAIGPPASGGPMVPLTEYHAAGARATTAVNREPVNRVALRADRSDGNEPQGDRQDESE